MKTGILTHQFRGNYGGMLQAYALQQALRTIGVESFIPEYSYPHELINESKRKLMLKARLRALQVRLGLASENTAHPLALMQLPVAEQFLNKYTQHVRIPLPLTADSPVHQFDRWIVGSDQVWRGEYSRNMAPFPFFFLDFATPDVRRRSVAYAASFGLDEWQGRADETEACKLLLAQFKAVSVREETGVSLCRSVFDVDAEQMPDPTLLLTAQSYSTLIDTERTYAPRKPYAAVYVLDESAQTQRLLSGYQAASDLEIQALMPHKLARRMRDRVPCRVTQWLRYIRDCSCVITDSFHGCVFAVIFNKPFVCLGNAERGMSRFHSLFARYGLQQRLLSSPSPSMVQDTLLTPIDWDGVNAAIGADRAMAVAWLQKHLGAEAK